MPNNNTALTADLVINMAIKINDSLNINCNRKTNTQAKNTLKLWL